MGKVLNNISPSNMFITLHPLVRFHTNYQFVLYDGAEKKLFFSAVHTCTIVALGSSEHKFFRGSVLSVPISYLTLPMLRLLLSRAQGRRYS